MSKSEGKKRNRCFLAMLLVAALFFQSGVPVRAAEDIGIGNYSSANPYHRVAATEAPSGSGGGGGYVPSWYMAYYYSGSEDNLVYSEYMSDVKYVLPECNFTIPEGCTFAGWRVISSLTAEEGKLKQPGEEISTDADAKIIAVWRCSIQYELNGGTNDPANPSTYDIGTGVSEFKPATKPDCEFLGWFDQAEGGKQITSIAANAKENITLYARYQSATYHITYDLDGGTLKDPNPDSFIYDTGVSSFNSPSKDGYEFEGWFDSNGTQYTSIQPNTINSDLALKARYRGQTYKITYELHGGTNNPANPAVYESQVGIPSFAAPTREGAVFECWYMKENDQKKEITSIPAGTTGDITIHAKYKNLSYTINYVLDGGINSPVNPTEYVCRNSYELRDAVKTGYEFLGWFTSAEGTDEITKITSTMTGDLTLYAHWKKASISLDKDRVTFEGGKNAKVRVNITAYAIEGDSLAEITYTNEKTEKNIVTVARIKNGYGKTVAFYVKSNKKTGTAVLRLISREGAERTLKVTVNRHYRLEMNSISINTESTYQIGLLDPYPLNAAIKECTSSDKSVVTVSSKGKITAKKKTGSATIIVHVKANGEKNVSLRLDVKVKANKKK